MRKISKRSDCPISYSLDLLGDKWTLLILRDIALNDKHFYKDFLGAGEGMATNVLSDRLKMLEQYGLIQSRPYEQRKTMKYYTLTEKGIALIPVLTQLWAWGAEFDPNSTISAAELHERRLNHEKGLEKYVQTARERAKGIE